MRPFCYVVILLSLCVNSHSGLVANPNTAEKIEPSRAHIRISNDVEDLIRTALKSEREAIWTTAVRNYQKAMELYPQYVVSQSILANTADAPTGLPNDARPVRDEKYKDVYWGVQYLCQQALRNMPAEGKQAYQEIFGQMAKHLFDQAYKIDPISSRLQSIDISKLSLLTERYPFTTYGRESLVILIRWYLEQSKLHQTARYYRQLNLDYPQIAESLPEAKIIKALLDRKEISRDGLWQTYAGNNTRTKIMTSGTGGDPAAPAEKRAYTPDGSFDYPPHIIKVTNSLVANPNMPFNPRYTSEQSIPYFPVVKPASPSLPAVPTGRQAGTTSGGDGIIYLPTGTGIYAFELGAKPDTANKLKEKWKYEIPFDEASPFFSESRMINTATVSPDTARLYVPLITAIEKHERKLGFLDVKYPFPRRTLFAFDTTTGKVLWATDKSAGDILFPLAPALENEVLYLAGIEMSNQTDIPEHYLFALNVENGELYFKTFVASGILETNLFNNPSREPIVSAVTVDKNNLYYCSQMGVICAVDKYSGQIKWLKKYPQYLIPNTYPDYIPHRLPLRWANNPIIYLPAPAVAGSGGDVADECQILVTAIDSPFLYVLSSRTGEELWRWNGDTAGVGNIRYLLGVNPALDGLVVSGQTGVVYLNLLKQGKIEWAISGHNFTGKGAIISPQAGGDDKIYLPTDKVILEVALKSGKLLNVMDYPNITPPPPGAVQENGGHLFFSGEFLISTSLKQMKIYKMK